MTASGLLNRKVIMFVIESKVVALPQAKEVFVGRFAPTDSLQPDLDLGPFGATEKGVSRRHAKITYKDGQTWIIDLSSMNGTWLNGQALEPIKEYPLRDGDKLRLGKLEMLVKFGTTAFMRAQAKP
jgi:pSer/pThr/pTyr-binding forkhead associated (FHA) protein